ncbi:protein disulfide oxidoreductase [Enterovibrio sp. ZSDZ42]|uniref:Protein disulfide oxidoreductase n=1 Tax=Enterovibrio gelatinilyticus TaxID=2899819 RepID=A0ABT5QWV1_9GAMM|nr:protein disulfide oxidoreductase [Enterovibrio sp. ZSDZ42]MDD1792502.1 protein disulfide oxidoreductase [Enterovibrio sp. ZSDZ42]
MSDNNTQQEAKPKSKWKSPKWWLRELATLIVLFSVMTFAIDWWRTQDMPKDAVPTIAMSTLSGESIDFVTLSHDEPVVLYFWATWCPACKFVTPTIDWLSSSYPVVSIAMTSGGNRRIQAYLDSHDLQFDTVNDEQGAIGQTWGIQATPTIVIIKDGKIESITTGITTPPGMLARLWFS